MGSTSFKHIPVIVMSPAKWLMVFVTMAWLAFGNAVKAEELAAAIAAGKVKVTFRGNGGSSGDTIEVAVVKTDKSAGNLDLTIAPGTRLQSGDSSAQNMVIAAVKGQLMGANSYAPTSVIRVGDVPKTYLLEAFCSDFEKDNPSSATPFTLRPVDPILACIFTEGSRLSVPAKQAAVLDLH